MKTNPTCPKCANTHTLRNGKSRHGHQRYICKKGCGVTFGEVNHRLVDEAKKEDALRHYAQGIGVRAIERLVKVSHNSVLNWVKQEISGKALARVDEAKIEVIEADELWTYVGKKNSPCGCGGLLIELPKEFLAGRWVIVTPERPERWVRRFLAALATPTAQTSTSPTARSLRPASTSGAKRTPTPSRA